MNKIVGEVYINIACLSGIKKI